MAVIVNFEKQEFLATQGGFLKLFRERGYEFKMIWFWGGGSIRDIKIVDYKACSNKNVGKNF